MAENEGAGVLSDDLSLASVPQAPGGVKRNRRGVPTPNRFIGLPERLSGVNSGRLLSRGVRHPAAAPGITP